MASFLARVETIARASALGQSTWLIGVVSGVHLIGLTLIVGSVLVSSLRLFGVLFAERPVPDVTSGTRRGIVTGLILSVTSGLLLAAPRAVLASGNAIFQLKMFLLAAAVGFHLVVYRRALAGDPVAVPPRVAAATGLVLWIGVVAAGSAFILLE